MRENRATYFQHDCPTLPCIRIRWWFLVCIAPRTRRRRPSFRENGGGKATRAFRDKICHKTGLTYTFLAERMKILNFNVSRFITSGGTLRSLQLTRRMNHREGRQLLL